jgi:succinate dehydrogenase / fumarate reductase cytochrome b subunit
MDKIRPTSPHLSIYKLPITAILSITHRITGVYIFLYIILAVNLYFLKSIAGNMALINIMQAFIILTCLFNFALAFHISAGLRYLLWGLGFGINLTFAQQSTIAILISTIIIGSYSSYLLIQKILL